MPARNVRVTTFDSEGKPGNVRYFLAYEPDKERAVELVRKRVPVNKGEEAEAVARYSEARLRLMTQAVSRIKWTGRDPDLNEAMVIRL